MRVFTLAALIFSVLLLVVQAAERSLPASAEDVALEGGDGTEISNPNVESSDDENLGPKPNQDYTYGQVRDINNDNNDEGNVNLEDLKSDGDKIADPYREGLGYDKPKFGDEGLVEEDNISDESVPNTYLIEINNSTYLQNGFETPLKEFYAELDKLKVPYKLNEPYDTPGILIGASLKLENPGDLAKIRKIPSFVNASEVKLHKGPGPVKKPTKTTKLIRPEEPEYEPSNPRLPDKDQVWNDENAYPYNNGGGGFPNRNGRPSYEGGSVYDKPKPSGYDFVPIPGIDC